MAAFFVSYAKADQPWAEWIAHALEAHGFPCLIQAWDFRPGSNFVIEMQEAARKAERTIMVLSPAYLRAAFPTPEWAAAFADDPQGLQRKLVPVRVEDCKPEGLLKSIVYIDLVGMDEAAASAALLRGVVPGRVKPDTVLFPGSGASSAHGPRFPGVAGSAREFTIDRQNRLLKLLKEQFPDHGIVKLHYFDYQLQPLVDRLESIFNLAGW